MGSLFEQALLLYLDDVVLHLMRELKTVETWSGSTEPADPPRGASAASAGRVGASAGVRLTLPAPLLESHARRLRPAVTLTLFPGGPRVWGPAPLHRGGQHETGSDRRRGPDRDRQVPRGALPLRRAGARRRGREGRARAGGLAAGRWTRSSSATRPGGVGQNPARQAAPGGFLVDRRSR
jgi:hypothetical protein